MNFLVFLKNNRGSKYNIKKNVLFLAVIKILNSLIGFLLVPLVLDYLDTAKYGVWLILSSFIGWIGLMDFGIGNSTKNILGKAWSNKDNLSAKKIVSTSYAVLFFIAIVYNTIFWLINPFLNWVVILNIDVFLLSEVKTLINFMFILISIRMVTGLILSILYVDHRPVVADLIMLIGNILSFVFVLILITKTYNSLLYIGTSLTFFTAIIPFILSIWFFKNDYKIISPSFSNIDFSTIKSFLSQGFHFTILQISTLVLTMTDMIIITQLYSPEEVVPYNISYRLFGYVVVLFGVLVAPFWAAYNDAYHNENFSWIKKSTCKLFKMWLFVSVGVIGMTFVSKYIYSFWIGEKVSIPFSLTFFMGIFVIVQILNSITSTFIYSTGKLTALTLSGVFISIINIPLCLVLAKNFNLGITGIIIASVICVLINCFVSLYQYYKIINNKDIGIWAR